jgi:hypothetical protein
MGPIGNKESPSSTFEIRICTPTFRLAFSFSFVIDVQMDVPDAVDGCPTRHITLLKCNRMRRRSFDVIATQNRNWPKMKVSFELVLDFSRSARLSSQRFSATHSMTFTTPP